MCGPTEIKDAGTKQGQYRCFHSERAPAAADLVLHLGRVVQRLRVHANSVEQARVIAAAGDDVQLVEDGGQLTRCGEGARERRRGGSGGVTVGLRLRAQALCGLLPQVHADSLHGLRIPPPSTL